MRLSQQILLSLSFDAQDLPRSSCQGKARCMQTSKLPPKLIPTEGTLTMLCMPLAGCHRFCFCGGHLYLWGVTCFLWGATCVGGGGGSTCVCGLSFVTCGCRGATSEKCSRGEARARSARGGSQPSQAHLESPCSHGLRYITCCCCCCYLSANNIFSAAATIKQHFLGCCKWQVAQLLQPVKLCMHSCCNFDSAFS